MKVVLIEWTLVIGMSVLFFACGLTINAVYSIHQHQINHPIEVTP